MAINPQAFNLRQFAQPGVSNRPMFQQAAAQTATQPIVPGGGIIGPLEKYLAENSIDPDAISGGAGDEVLIGGAGANALAGRGPSRAPYITQAPGPAALQQAAVEEAAVEEPPVPGRPFGLDPAKDKVDMEALMKGTVTAGGSDPNAGGPEGENKLRAAVAQTEAVTGDDSFENQLKLMGLGTQYTQDDYNEKAKKLLGLDQDEDDVPAWAAPLFLFGLELLKGEGPGDLLGDIGAAGTKAFPVFGAEIARRRKDRKDVGMLAYQMETADKAARAAAMKFQWEQTSFYLKHNLEQREKMGDNLDKIVDRYTQDYSGEQVAEFTFAVSDVLDTMGPVAGETLHANGNPYTEQEVLNWQARTLQNPISRNLIAATAQKESGLRPNIELKDVDIPGGGKIWYSPDAVRRHANNLKGDNKGDQSLVISKMVANPADYPQLVVSQSYDSNAIQVVSQEEGGFTQNFLENTILRDKWVRENPGKTPTAADITTWRSPYDDKRIKGRTEFKQYKFGTDDSGVEKSVWIDENKLLTRLNKGDVTIADILADPKKYPGIISGEHSDYSGVVAGINAQEFAVGPNEKVKALVNEWEWASQLPELTKKYKTAEDATVSLKSIPLQELVDRGIVSVIGTPYERGSDQTIFSLDMDNMKVRSITGDPAANSAFLTKEAGDKFEQRGQAVLGANTAAHDIFKILNSQLDNAGVISSSWTDIKGAFLAAGRLVGVTSPATMNSQLSQMRKASDDSAGLVDAFISGFDSWAEETDMDQIQRQQLKSIFTNLAFQKASSREGGKLTDNDVKWAFGTLGYDTTQFFQNPKAIMAGLYESLKEMNEKYEVDGISKLDDAQLKVYDERIGKNKRWKLLEHSLKQRISRAEGYDNMRAAGEAEDGFYRYDKWFNKTHPGFFERAGAVETPGGAAATISERGAPTFELPARNDLYKIIFQGEPITDFATMREQAEAFIDTLPSGDQADMWNRVSGIFLEINQLNLPGWE